LCACLTCPMRAAWTEDGISVECIHLKALNFPSNVSVCKIYELLL
jgi:hypothetical protein